MRAATVVSPGPLSTVQDLGRPGYGHLGIGRSGAADRRSLQLANRIVGNEKGAAAIESTLGRLRLRFDFDAVVALTGAPCAITAAGRPADMNTPRVVPAGEEIRLGPPTIGLRTYLAVRGGIAVPPVLGSRSTDTLSGIGPEKLRAGTVLPVGSDPVGSDPVGSDPAGNDPGRNGAGGEGLVAEPIDPVGLDPDPVLTVLRGPRDDWFTADAWQTLLSATWSVAAEANRIGVRLTGPALARRLDRQLPSEPMVVGALQVPPNGQPIIFLADHPVTGGYPVIGVVSGTDLHLVGQLRPGRSVRFRSLQPSPGP